ncbi:MAG TPA: MBL fold metallo-hydrolase [Candidatus Binataceae bacterium]|jgi:glyoxylase-like metal-dependent hydrolase (beta-lactamase superfamily II)/rhodanese-related sulfurtransferase
MNFRELNNAKCKTYLLASESMERAVIVDPLKDKVERYLGVLAYHRLKLDLIIDTHTHADHRSGARELAELTDAPVAMHRRAPAPHVTLHLEDGQRLIVGDFEMKVLYTPGHTPDSLSLFAEDRVLTGDCLLIHGTGRADFAGGDAGEEYDSITQKLFTLPDPTLVYPAHDYRGHIRSTIAEEKASNPRVAGRSREAYVDLMNNLGLPLPDGIQEALQPNQTEIEAAAIHFPTLAQLNSVRQLSPAEIAGGLGSAAAPLLLDVREREEYLGELGHIAGARLIPLRELPERAEKELAPFKDKEIVVICRAGMRSVTAAAILTGLGFEKVCSMKGGMLDWDDAHLPVER